MKTEALQLADELNTWISCLNCGQRVSRDSIHTCSPQTKPLSDEEIGLLTTDKRWSHIESPLLLDFARAIEERHGIK